MFKKKLGFIFLGVLAFFSSVNSSTTWEILARGAVVHPFSKNVQNVYSNVMGEAQVFVGRKFYKNLYGWLQTGYLSNRGKSCNVGCDTRIQIIPLSFGVKYGYECFTDFQVDLGVGALFNHIRIDDDSNFVTRHLHENSWGFSTKLGVTYKMFKHILLNTFIDYDFQRVRFDCAIGCNNPKLTLDNIKFGLGMGFSF